MSNTYCVITLCKTTAYNKPPGVTFHQCPKSNDMRNKWLLVLKNKCNVIDWERSKICSRHFENKFFDYQRKLKDNAIPTLFPIENAQKIEMTKPKLSKLLSKQSQADLMIDVKSALNKLKEPSNLENFVNDELKCKSNAPVEAKLWVLIKKQDHLITKLMEQVSQNRKHVEALKANMEASRLSKLEVEQNLETMKYIVQSLQEKHATLEEQIEILTAVEAVEET